MLDAEATLEVSFDTVVPGDSAQLRWSAPGATGCVASGGWSGERSPYGSESTGRLTESTTFTLRCSGDGASGESSVSVAVSDIDTTPVHLSDDVQSTADTRLLAASLGNDPRRILEYLRNEIEFAPYYHGSLKGAQETLLQRSGNDYDLASLLIALLHDSDIDARYARGIVSIPIDEALGWIGVAGSDEATDTTVALNILRAAGREAELIEEGNGVHRLRLPHVWVEASLDEGGQRRWVPLDPSYRRHAVLPAVDIVAEAGLSTRALLEEVRAASRVSPDGDEIVLPLPERVDEIRGRASDALLAHLREEAPSLTMDELMGGRRIIPVALASLPTEPAFAPEGDVETFEEIPESDRFHVEVFFQGINARLPIASLAGRPLTLSYAPAGAADRATLEAAGDLSGLAPGAVRMTPRLQAGDELLAEGTAGELGSALFNNLQVSFYRGGFTQLGSVLHQNIAVGGHYAIVLSTEGFSQQKLRRGFESVFAERPPTDPEPNWIGARSTGELLDLLGQVYFAYQERFMDHAASMHDALAFHAINEALVSLPLRTADGRVSIDAPRIDNQLNGYRAVPRDGTATDPESLWYAFGLGASTLEADVFGAVLGVPAVSTMSLVREAMSTRTPIHVLDADNVDTVLPSLTLAPLQRGAVSTAVAQGKSVIVPGDELGVGGWNGYGWIEHPVDPGSGGFLLSSGLRGGEAFWNAIGAVVDFILGFFFGTPSPDPGPDPPTPLPPQPPVVVVQNNFPISVQPPDSIEITLTTIWNVVIQILIDIYGGGEATPAPGQTPTEPGGPPPARTGPVFAAAIAPGYVKHFGPIAVLAGILSDIDAETIRRARLRSLDGFTTRAEARQRGETLLAHVKRHHTVDGAGVHDASGNRVRSVFASGTSDARLRQIHAEILEGDFTYRFDEFANTGKTLVVRDAVTPGKLYLYRRVDAVGLGTDGGVLDYVRLPLFPDGTSPTMFPVSLADIPGAARL